MSVQDRTFRRSLSSKEASFSNLISFTPPRLSLAAAPTSTPPFSLPTPPHDKTTTSSAPPPYQCISSVLKKDGQITSIASSNGLLYTGSEKNIIRVWKLPEYTECGSLKTKARMVVALQVTNDRVYAAYADCKIRVWHRSWNNGSIKHVRLATVPSAGSFVRSYIGGKDKLMKKHMGLISSLAINVVEDIVYSASLDKTVKVWRISDFKCIETIQAHSESLNAILVGDDGVLYTASDDATVRVWRRNFCSEDMPHALIVTLPAKNSPIKTLTLTSDGGVLYGGCSDGYIHFWLKGWFSGQLQYGGALQGHTHAVMCLASVSNYLASGSADSTCRVWVKEKDGQHMCIAVLQGHRGPIRCVAAFKTTLRVGERETDDTGCTVCTGSLDGVLKVWRVMRTGTSEMASSTQNGSKYFELQTKNRLNRH